MAEAQVDTTRAQLETARWELTQTTVRAPGNGTMVNVMLRPGFFVAGMPFNEVMTFVDNEYQIFALFGQNELHQVAPGNEVEITLDTYPGRIIKAHVDSVIWAQAQGQLDASGDLPRTTIATPPGRFPGEAGGRGARPLAVPRRRRARRGGHLHRPSGPGAHHPQGPAARRVVPQLRHHQAQHQPRSLVSGDDDGDADPFVQPKRESLALPLAAVGRAGGRVRPEVAARQRPPSRPRRCPPSSCRSAWTAAAISGAAPADNWLAVVRRSAARRRRSPRRSTHNADLRVGAARVEQALLYAKLAGAKLYPSVDVLARGGGKMSGDNSGLPGAVLTVGWELDLWGRVRYGRAAARADAASAQADFEFARQSIAARWPGAGSSRPKRALQAELARRTIRDTEALVGWRRTARASASATKRTSSSRAPTVGTYRDSLRQIELAREQAIRALENLLGRYPSAPRR